MKADVMPKPKNMFQAYMLLFLVSSGQIGVGIFGFQRIVGVYSDHDAWISVIVAGLVSHIVVGLMFWILSRYESADLYGIHQHLFGKWIGNGLSMVLMLYYLMVSVTIVRTYIELIQSWVFPTFPTWILSMTLLLLAWYGTTGGIRLIAGLSTISFFVILFFMGTLYISPIKYASWSHLLPIGEASPWAIMKGTISMGLTISGFESIFYFYPYIKDKSNGAKYAQYSLLFSNIIYLFMMILGIVYFSKGQLTRSIWASTSMLKIVKFPFLERLEYIASSVWMFVVIPGLMIYIWVLGRGFKRMMGWKQRIMTPIICFVVFIGSLISQDREHIHMLSTFTGRSALFVVFLYPVVLFLFQTLILGIRDQSDKKGAAE